ncbi:MAG: hypothetical protein KDD42_08080, partial [Bdellovibrionales bacterium]|nr:hypothetical protein [Bdellovibrionales bacterium]
MRDTRAHTTWPITVQLEGSQSVKVEDTAFFGDYDARFSEKAAGRLGYYSAALDLSDSPGESKKLRPKIRRLTDALADAPGCAPEFLNDLSRFGALESANNRSILYRELARKAAHFGDEDAFAITSFAISELQRDTTSLRASLSAARLIQATASFTPRSTESFLSLFVSPETRFPQALLRIELPSAIPNVVPSPVLDSIKNRCLSYAAGKGDVSDLEGLLAIRAAGFANDKSTQGVVWKLARTGALSTVDLIKHVGAWENGSFGGVFGPVPRLIAAISVGVAAMNGYLTGSLFNPNSIIALMP